MQMAEEGVMENRQDLRWLGNHEAIITTLGENSTVFTATTVDFSKRGIGLVSKTPVPRGTLLRIELLGVMLLGEAVYAEAEDDGFRVGIRIEHMLQDEEAIARAGSRAGRIRSHLTEALGN